MANGWAGPKCSSVALGSLFLRSQGLSWAHVAEILGVGEGTVPRAAQASAKNVVPKTAS